MPPYARGDTGLTLIETAIAAVILLSLMIPVSAMLNAGSKNISNSEGRREALGLVQEQLTQLSGLQSENASQPTAQALPASLAHWISNTWVEYSGNPVTVNGTSFNLSESFGTCSLSSGNWTSAPSTTVPSTHLGYFVAWRATWGPAGASNSATDSSELSVVPLSVGTACPLSLS